MDALRTPRRPEIVTFALRRVPRGFAKVKKFYINFPQTCGTGGVSLAFRTEKNRQGAATGSFCSKERIMAAQPLLIDPCACSADREAVARIPPRPTH
jgi:hypothetical protein